MSSKPIKTLYLSSFNYINLGRDLVTGFNQYSFNVSSAGQEYIQLDSSGNSQQGYYNSDDILEGDWLIDLRSGRSLRISKSLLDTNTGGRILTLEDYKNYEELNNTLDSIIPFSESNNSAFIFSIDTATNQPLLNFLEVNKYIVPNFYFFSALQNKFQYLFPTKAKTTQSILSNKEIYTGQAAVSKYVLGLASVPTAMTGTFYFLINKTYAPNSPAPTCTLNVQEVGGASALFSKIVDASTTSANAHFNTLISVSSQSLVKDKIYEVYLSGMTAGMTASITLYFIQD